MSENRVGDGDGDPSVVGIRCEGYPDDCQFAMQAGVFGDGPGFTQLLPTMSARETCPFCGGTVEEWNPEYEGTAPGRPLEW
jgi:hypothetical protein